MAKVIRTTALCSTAPPTGTKNNNNSKSRTPASSLPEIDWLATFAHEVRTPLQAMLGFAELLLTPDEGHPLSERQHAQIEQIANSGRHLTALIEDMLAMAQLTSGRFPLHLMEVDPFALCQDVARELMPLAQDRSQTLSVAGDANLRMQADPERLHQLLINLVGNAIKFSPRGGTITMSVHAGASATKTVELAVQDTGPGIPRRLHAAIFRPFVRFDGRVESGHKGLGLGLALVREIARQHRGKVWVESAVGKGSTFRVRLPAA